MDSGEAKKLVNLINKQTGDNITDYTGEAYNVYYNNILTAEKKSAYRACVHQATHWNSEYKVGENISTQKTFIYGG